MTAFNPGSSGQMFSTYKSAALLEMAYVLDTVERNNSTIDNPINNITITADFEARSVAIAATLPIAPAIDINGGIVINAQNYLNSFINLGQGSDVKATSHPGIFLEIAQILAAAEQALSTPVNNIAISFDLEGRTSTVTAAIPITVNRNADGVIELIAADYA